MKSSKGPKERDATIRVSKFKNVFGYKREANRDPRFDNLSGTLNSDLYQKSY